MRLTSAVAMCPEVMCSRRLAAQPLGGRASAQRVISAHLPRLARFGTCECNASGRSGRSMGGFRRVMWAALVVQGHSELGRCLGDVLCSLPWSPAHAYRAFCSNRKKNACNGRIYGRLSGRNYDISRFKSSFIPPVRSPEAWGARPSELRTCRNLSNPAYRYLKVTPFESPLKKCRTN